MELYREITEEFSKAASEYVKKGELPRISKPIQVNGKEYCEVIYTKGSGNDAEGRLVVDERGRAVSDKSMQKKVVRLFYYSRISDTWIEDLIKLRKSEEDAEEEKEKYEVASILLKDFVNEDVTGASDVKKVVDKFPDMRKEGDEVLKQAIECMAQYGREDNNLTEEALENILSLYEKTHIMSFERVKFINGAAAYYNIIMKKVTKGRRLSALFSLRKTGSPKEALENILSFYVSILRYYGEAINYPNSKYLKLLEKKDLENIEKCFAQVRNN